MSMFSREGPSLTDMYDLQDTLGELQNKLAQLPDKVEFIRDGNVLSIFCDGMDYEEGVCPNFKSLYATDLALMLSMIMSIFGYKRTWCVFTDKDSIIFERDRSIL